MLLCKVNEQLSHSDGYVQIYIQIFKNNIHHQTKISRTLVKSSDPNVLNTR